ncbi:hypothetical protein Tco_0831289 [Tanacetum coccineum]
MTIIGTKWVYRNKLDENGVVSRNKARLESIRILLAYACALDFKLFQMDVKSAFLNGFINGEEASLYDVVAGTTFTPEYVQEPIGAEGDHVPVYIPEPEHPEDLVAATDELIIPEAMTPQTRQQKRLLLTTPRPVCEGMEEIYHLARCGHQVPTKAQESIHSLVDTMETRFRDTERRMMNDRLRVGQQEGHLPAVRAEIEVLRRERLAYEQESMETRQALARSKAHCRALEARVTVLETEVLRHEWQRQAVDDLAVQHIMRTQALEAGARVDKLEDTGSSS